LTSQSRPTSTLKEPKKLNRFSKSEGQELEKLGHSERNGNQNKYIFNESGKEC
jgi:hypothetical protein